MFVMTSDTLLSLVDRINSLEKDLTAANARITELAGTVQDNFDSLIDYVPTVDGDRLKMKAFGGDEEPDEVRVPYDVSEAG